MIKHIVILSLFFLPFLASQTIAPDVTNVKKRLLVLTADESKPNDALDRKISKIVAEIATDLGRYEVIDRNQLESILNELALHQSGIIAAKDILELGNIASANEAMKVQITHYSQKGVPLEDDDEEEDKGFWKMVVYESVKGAIRLATTPKNEEPYANNMETIIQADIILLNVITGQTIDTYPIRAAHTGGSRGKSLGIALNQIRSKIFRALKNIYIIKTEVLDVNGSKVTLILGSDLGVKKGTVYEISRLDKKKVLSGREITIPGKTVGLVRINRVSNDASIGTIIRKWGRVKGGYQAEELVSPPSASGGITLQYNLERQAIDHGGLLIQLNPLSKWGGFFHLGGGSIFDSRNDKDFMFTFGGGINYRFLYTPQFNLGGIVDIPFSFVSRNDDFNNSVTNVLMTPQIGLQTEIMINRKLDLVIRAGYSSSNTLGKWTYSKGEGDDSKQFDAEWDGLAPTLDASGIYFNFSIRYLEIDIDF